MTNKRRKRKINHNKGEDIVLGRYFNIHPVKLHVISHTALYSLEDADLTPGHVMGSASQPRRMRADAGVCAATGGRSRSRWGGSALPSPDALALPRLSPPRVLVVPWDREILMQGP